DVPILLDATIEDIVQRNGVVSGVSVRQGSETRLIHSRGGLVSATGGFNLDPERRARLLPGLDPDWSAVADGTTASLHSAIERLGGHYGPTGDSAAFWAPVSLPPRRGGGHGVYPHFA